MIRNTIRNFRKISIYLVTGIFLCISLFIHIDRNPDAQSFIEDDDWYLQDGYDDLNSSNVDVVSMPGSVLLSSDPEDDRLLIADKGNRRIIQTERSKLQWKRFLGSQIDRLDGPIGMCYDDTDDVLYAADSRNDRIIMLDLYEGTFTPFGGYGSGEGQFDAPHDVWYDPGSGHIFVADTFNSRIVETDMEGYFWEEWGTPGEGPTDFAWPSHLVYDPETELVYVTDMYNSRIVRTRMDGTGWETFGTEGTGEGQFSFPMGLDYDSSSGYLYIVDNDAIVKTKFGGSDWTKLEHNENGSQYFEYPVDVFYCEDSKKLYIIDQEIGLVGTMFDGSYWNSSGSEGNGTGQFKDPYGITFDPSTENIYIGDYGNDRIVRTNNDLTVWDAIENQGFENEELSSPEGIFFESENETIFVADSGNDRIISSGPNGTNFDHLTGFNSPEDVFYDKDSGFIYVADSFNDRIIKTRMNGSGWTELKRSSSGDDRLNNPQSVHYDSSSGFLYISDQWNDRIVRTKMDGSEWTTLESAGWFSIHFDYPYGIYYDDEHDHIYLADYMNDRVVRTKMDGSDCREFYGDLYGPIDVYFDNTTGWIYVIDLNGITIFDNETGDSRVLWDEGGHIGQFNNPYGICGDSDSGRIFIADSGSNEIIETSVGPELNFLGPRFDYDEIGSPGGLDYDPFSNRLFFTDTENDRIILTDPEYDTWIDIAERLEHSGIDDPLYRPGGLECFPGGKTFTVCDSGNSRIVEYALFPGLSSFDVIPMFNFGSLGSGVGHFNNPVDLTINSLDRRYIVTDSNNSRIVMFDYEGENWTSLGYFGNGVRRFNKPHGIDCDPANGMIFIADSGNDRIVSTCMDGSEWKTLGSSGHGVEQFSNPTGLKYDPRSEFLYIVDSGNNRIVRTKIDGTGWELIHHGYEDRLLFFSANDIDTVVKFEEEGIFVSKPLEFDGRKKLTRIGISRYQPDGTSISFQYRTSLTEEGLRTEPFSGPDGTELTYYTSSETEIDDSDDIRYIQYRVFLSTTDTRRSPIFHSITFDTNVKPDRPEIVNPQTAEWTNEDIELEWRHIDQDSLEQTGFRLQIDDDPDFSSLRFDTGDIMESTTTFNTSGLSLNGMFYWRVQTCDESIFWSEYSEIGCFKIDRNSPLDLMLHLIPSKYVSDNVIELEFSASDSCSGIDRFSLSIDNGPLTDVESPYRTPYLNEGSHSLFLFVYDRAGNSRSTTTYFMIDKTKPTEIGFWTCPEGWIDYTNPEIYILVDDYGSEIARCEVNCSGEIIIFYSPSLKLHGLEDGSNNILIKVFDKAGNYRSRWVTIKVDTTDPEWIEMNPDCLNWTSLYEIEIEYEGFDNSSGIDHYRIISEEEDLITYNETVVLYYLDEGWNDVLIEAFDRVGHSINGTFQVKVDRSSPRIEHIVPNSSKAGEDLAIWAGVSDNLSGVKEVELHYKNDEQDHYSIVQMEDKEGGYHAIIPANETITDTIHYFLRAEDASNPSNHIYFGKGNETELMPYDYTDIDIELIRSEVIEEKRDEKRGSPVLVIVIILILLLSMILGGFAGYRMMSDKRTSHPLEKEIEKEPDIENRYS